MTNGVEVLDESGCWEQLAQASIGRVVLATADELEIFPVNFTVHERSVLFRSAPGTKLELVLDRARIAFEADDFTATRAWSVVVHGTAERLASDDEIVASGVDRLVSWTPVEKDNFVRIIPDRISGRRFRRADA